MVKVEVFVGDDRALAGTQGFDGAVELSDRQGREGIVEHQDGGAGLGLEPAVEPGKDDGEGLVGALVIPNEIGADAIAGGIVHWAIQIASEGEGGPISVSCEGQCSQRSLLEQVGGGLGLGKRVLPIEAVGGDARKQLEDEQPGEKLALPLIEELPQAGKGRSRRGAGRNREDRPQPKRHDQQNKCIAPMANAAAMLEVGHAENGEGAAAV